MEKNFQYNNATVFYHLEGSGNPVILLHGFAEDHTIWKNQIEKLSQHFQLILPDLPGSGKSDILTKDNVGMEDYADCIKAMAEKEKLSNFILLGHSMGGYIALAYAEKYMHDLKGWGFVHSTAFADNEEKKEVRKKGIKLLEEYGSHAFLKNTTPNLFSDSFKKAHPDTVNDLIEQGRSFSPDALIQYYRAMMQRPDRSYVLKESKVPVIFVIGAEDKAAPLQDLLEQVHLPNVSYINIIDNVGHMSMLEMPETLNSVLLTFLDDLSFHR